MTDMGIAMDKCPSNDADDIARWCIRDVRGGMTDEQYRKTVFQIREAIQNGFDCGFRAAGGDIIPLVSHD